MASRTTPPRVLVFSFDVGPILELRVRAPLNALFEVGKIPGYNMPNGTGHPCGPHEFEQYDCVMVQRDAPSWFIGLMSAGEITIEQGFPSPNQPHKTRRWLCNVPMKAGIALES